MFRVVTYGTTGSINKVKSKNFFAEKFFCPSQAQANLTLLTLRVQIKTPRGGRTQVQEMKNIPPRISILTRKEVLSGILRRSRSKCKKYGMCDV